MRRGLALLVAALVGCATPGDRAVESADSPLRDESYAAAAGRGADVYRVVTGESLVLVRVGRAGPASRLGHDHAVASETVSGFIECSDDPADSRADFSFPVRELVVDKAVYRDRLGLDTEPSAEDIAGTYRNMMKVLEPDLYPWVAIRARIAETRADGLDLAVSVTLHGATAEFLVPAQIVVDGPRLIAEGSATVRHSDFALEPFSVMGGLLRVADELAIHVHIVAQPLDRAKRSKGAACKAHGANLTPDAMSGIDFSGQAQ